jgi:hypothetical protein
VGGVILGMTAQMIFKRDIYATRGNPLFYPAKTRTWRAVAALERVEHNRVAYYAMSREGLADYAALIRPTSS